MGAEETEQHWSRIALYTSRDVLRTRYHQTHGVELETAKADAIIAHLEQAKQYFESSDDAGVLAGPLEQYYGILAFCRAIILFRDGALKEADLLPSHGLSAAIPEGGAIADSQLMIGQGTFSQLLKVTGNFESLYVDEVSLSQSVNRPRTEFRRSLPAPAKKQTFGLMALLSRTAQLRELFGQAIGQAANCHQATLHRFQSLFHLTIHSGSLGTLGVEELRKRLGLHDEDKAVVYSHPEAAIRFDILMSSGQVLAERLPYVVDLPEGGQVAVEDFPGAWALNQVSTYFAAAHVMSMLVRYHPTRWAAMVNHTGDDRVWPLLQSMRRLLQRDFPRIALWELEHASTGTGQPIGVEDHHS